jgi:hypothetical protein
MRGQPVMRALNVYDHESPPEKRMLDGGVVDRPSP